ncbi:MAG: hypothetical protein DRG09_03245 [Epsilonproteobacteria bacterium]|nr:MAG: hypothetical protein DRG09_03245 [Campylobacterota bacterium]
MHTVKTLSTLTLTFILLGFSTLLASEKSALEIINKALKHTASLNSYLFKTNTSEKEALEDGTFVTYKYTTNVKVQRPGKLRIDTKGQYLNRTITVNNGLYTVMRHNDNTYSQMNVPKDIDHAIKAILHKYKLKKEPLAALVYGDVASHVKLHKGLYIGSEKLDDRHCDHVRFVKSNREVDIWVTQSDTPQIIAYNIKDTSEQPFVYTQTKINWDEKVNIEESDFVFKAPIKSSKVAIVTEDSD